MSALPAMSALQAISRAFKQPHQSGMSAGEARADRPAHPAEADPFPAEQNMEALGRLTAGVAHDFNNLLTVILGNAAMLRAAAETRGNSSDISRAAAIESAAQRGGRLAAQLLAFARKQVLYPETVSVYEALSGLLDLLSRAAGDAVQIRLVGGENLWTCRVDLSQLESAMLNLVINARDAMPAGGDITITCHNQGAAKGGGTFQQDYVRVDVADTGTGIPTHLAQRVFEPFFTTKPVGQGSGLGLAQVHGFAGQSGGRVELASTPGIGTTVSLLLPRTLDESSPDVTRQQAASAARPVALLVEPDPGLRNAAAAALASAGLKVLEAGTASGATRLVMAQQDLDVLITRTALPANLTGIDLAKAARRVRPGLPLVLLTDGGNEPAARRLVGDGRCEMIRTPYATADVVRVTQALLCAQSFSAEQEQLYSELRDRPFAEAVIATDRHGHPPLKTRARSHADPVYARGALRLGVAPLRNLGSSLDDAFSVGLAEELTCAFSRFRWISCLSPASVAALNTRADRSDPAWLALNLDYLLEGSFRQARNGIRITVRLINMRSPGEVSWTRRLDGSLADVLSLQDQIAADIAAQVGPEMLVWGGEEARARSQVDPTSYGLTLRAIPAIYRLDKAGFEEAGPMLEQALALDPSNAAAHSWLAHWYMLLAGQGWAADMRQAAQRADQLAKRAIMLDPADARGLTVAGHVRAFLYRDAGEALCLHERALDQNPNLALAWCYSGLAHCYLGQHEEALEAVRHAKALSPHDPHSFFFDMAMTMPLLLTGDYEAAAKVGRRARYANPSLSSTYKGLISALGHLGLLEEASVLLHELTSLEPCFSVQRAVSRSPLTRAADLQRYAEGLRLAGCRERSPRQTLVGAASSIRNAIASSSAKLRPYRSASRGSPPLKSVTPYSIP
jgi:signal transduction histidine kinase/TolB-like protein/DNA-binding NarL/FixJ family response regulator/Flp pilus assembly protein TadD